MEFAFTPERRRDACIHESAHAITHALGGIPVEQLSVLPVGLMLLDDKSDQCGYCKVDPHPAAFFIAWQNDKSIFNINKAGLVSFIKQCERQAPRYNGCLLSTEVWRQLRVHVCSLLAGETAQAIYRSSLPIFTRRCIGMPTDLDYATAYCALLPFRNEFDHLVSETERVLRLPEVWESVVKLANILEQVGTLGEGGKEIPYLPEPLKSWPKSLRSKHRD